MRSLGCSGGPGLARWPDSSWPGRPGVTAGLRRPAGLGHGAGVQLGTARSAGGRQAGGAGGQGMGAAGRRLAWVVNNVGAVTPRLDGFVSPVTDEQWLSSLTLTFLAAVRTTRRRVAQHAGGRTRGHRHRGSVNAFLPDPAVIITRPPRPLWPTSPSRCPRRSAPGASGVNTVILDRSRPACGWETPASPRPSAGLRALTRLRSFASRSSRPRLDDSPARNKSLTSSSSSPATGPGMLPAQTS